MSKRRMLTTLVIPVLLISGLILFLLNNPRESPPELILSQQQIHFGTLPEWEGAVTRSVTARNTSKNPRRIQNVHIGCSYAEITGPEVIHPNAEGTFHITINPEILPADETSARVTIFTDSPETPTLSLTIIAAAKRFATLSPDACDFGNIHPDTTHQQTVTLAVHAPLNTSEIRLLPSSHPKLTWEMSADTARITIHLGPLKDKDTGTFASLLTLAFPNERTLTLPVTARVIAPTTENPQPKTIGNSKNKHAHPGPQ